MRLTKALTAPFRAAGRGLKALTVGWSRSWLFDNWRFLLPRTRFDYAREVGDGTSSSIVVAVVNWMARTFPEAPVIVIDPKHQKVEGHPMPVLLERPNAHYSGVLLWMATIIDWATTGNAYWLKVRSPANRPAELWWAPSWCIEPKWSQDSDEFITHYEYKPDSRPATPIVPADVVHFRYGIDPLNTRKGLSQLRSLFREIFTDDEAANFTASLMRNLGIPGIIISPEGQNVSLKEGDAEKIKQDMGKFSGDKRGEPMVMSAATKVQVLSFSPDQMNLRDLRRVPEERVSAVFGVAAVVAGLGAGLDRSTFTNFSEAREAAYEGNIIPTQRLMAADLRNQLLRDFTDDKTLDVEFDLTRVRVLQPDMDKLAERARTLVNAGIATVGDGRRLVSLPAGPQHEVYLRLMTMVEVSAKGAKAAGALGFKGDGVTAFAEAVNGARARLTSRFEADIGRFFKEQAKRVHQRLGTMVNLRARDGGSVKTELAATGLIPREEDELLAAALGPVWIAGAEVGWTAGGSAFALDSAFDAADPVLIAALADGIFRAKRINDGTRKSIEEALQQGQGAGYTAQQIVFGVQDDEFTGLLDRVESEYENRAGIITLTEATWATNCGLVALYRKTGINRVQIVDNPACELCAPRNGVIMSAEAALSLSLIHISEPTRPY